MADLLKVKRECGIEQQSSIYSDTTETERFCRIYNHLFDCLNTCHLYEAEHKRNEALKAYSSKDDPRLKVHLHYTREFCVTAFLCFIVVREGISALH